MTILRLVVAGCLALVSHEAGAFAPHEHANDQHFAKQGILGQKILRPRSKVAATPGFLQALGNKIVVERDTRSGAIRLITGDLLVGAALASDAKLDDYLQAIQDYISINSELGFAYDDLAINADATLIDRDVAFFKFKVVRDGLVIEDANVDFRFKQGRLVQVVNESYTEAASDERPTSTRMLKMAAAQLGTSAIHAAGKAYRVVEQKRGYRLARVQKYETERGGIPYIAQVEEASGLVHEVAPTVYFINGVATAQIHPRYYAEELETTPIPKLSLIDPSSKVTVNTSVDGTFAAAGDAKPGLDGFAGPQVKVAASTGGTTKVAGSMEGDQWVVAATKVGSAAASEDKGIAQAMAFYHTNKVIDYARGFISTPWFDRQLLANVNLSQTCNAFWNGRSINFFSAGKNGSLNCANTGLIADVMYHEWGHGLDANTGGIEDGAYSEGFSDIVSMLITRSNILGIGFITDGRPVRDLAPDKVYPKDKGEVHAEGLIIGSTFYDLYEEFKAQYGDDAAIELLSRYALKSIFTAKKYTDVYQAVLVIDDDDADLTNGTPNFCTVNRVFSAHGLATLDPRCVVARVDAILLDDAGGGNDNGVAEPGERVRIAATITNPSNLDADNLIGTASLVSTETGITLSNDQLDFGDVKAGTRKTSRNALEVAIARDVPCGADFRILLNLKAGERSELHQSDMLVGRIIGEESVLTASDLPKDIDDFQTVATSFDVAGEQWNNQTKVRKAHLRFKINHAYPDDLVARLIAPNGRAFTVLRDPGSEEREVVFDRDITAIIGNDNVGEGRWTLQVEDTSAGDAGQLLEASLSLSPRKFFCSPIN